MTTTFDVIDIHEIPTQDQTAPPSFSSQSLSPSAPPPLPSPLHATTSSSSINLNVAAPTFYVLLAASFAACLISGLTFQWVTEKGLFRQKQFWKKANHYNVLVAVASLAALLETLGCFIQVLLDAPNLYLTLFNLLNWILMTHASVMIVARKVSLTQPHAEQAWKRLLAINAVMMVVSLLVCVVTIGAYHSDKEIFDDIQRILEPVQIALWGAMEFVLSGLFIVQMRKYYWQAVERKGMVVLIVVGLCDCGLVALSIVQEDDLISVACLRGLVYALRIRLELEVLSAMVTYIQTKRKEVVYKERKRRRNKAKRQLKQQSSSGDLMDDESNSNRSLFSFSNLSFSNLRRLRKLRRKNSKNSSFGDLLDDDDDDSCASHRSIFSSVLRRNKRRKNNSDSGNMDLDDDDDDSCNSTHSHMSVFRRLPHATDYSKLFQHNFMEDFAAATHCGGSFLQRSARSLSRKCRTLAHSAADQCTASVTGRSTTKGSKKNVMGQLSKTNRTQATMRNSTSSCEIPIQGMQITVRPASVPELGNDSDALQDMEGGTSDHCGRPIRYDIISSLQFTDQSESERGAPFYNGGVSSSEFALTDISDDSDNEGDDDGGQASDDTPQLRGSYGNQANIPTIPVRMRSIDSQSTIDDDDEEYVIKVEDKNEAEDGDEPMMFGIPRSSYMVKDLSDEEDTDQAEAQDESMVFGIPRSSYTVKDLSDPATETVECAPFGIARESVKTRQDEPATPQHKSVQDDESPELRRCHSADRSNLPPLRRSSSGNLRESRLVTQISRRDRERRTSNNKEEEDSEALRRALNKLESMDCL